MVKTKKLFFSVCWPFLLISAFLSINIHAFSALSREKITIKDSLNRQVEVRVPAQRIICLQPELLRILVALDEGERVLAVDRFPVRYDHLAKIIFPEVSKLPVVSVTGEDANLEKIMELNPDLVLVSPSELNLTQNLSRKLNCPVISLSSSGRIDRLLEEIEILARLTGKEQRGEELKNFLVAGLESLKQKLNRPGLKKPRVYLSFWGSLLRSPVNYQPVELAGGLNLTSQIKPIHQGSDTAVLKLETLLSWNPDLILVHGLYPPEERKITVQQLLTDPGLQYLKAVQEKKVFYTFGFWYWWDPALVLVECYYLAWLFHPEEMSGVDLMVEGEKSFKKFYGQEGLFKALCDRIKAHEWFKK